ncbi:hypothetical protein D3Z55_18070 [Clostridiaceae bacterium]|nr:hypothetical protein [Clostridiaceae bacterium]
MWSRNRKKFAVLSLFSQLHLCKLIMALLNIEEYKNKTIGLLFTYPISRTKLIMAKFILICCISFTFHVQKSYRPFQSYH